jgi:hypothetical protein
MSGERLRFGSWKWALNYYVPDISRNKEQKKLKFMGTQLSDI